MRALTILGGLVAAATGLFAQLTEAQRVQDFQALAGIYAKSYAPANWKIQALGINIFENGEWLKKVRAAKSDLAHVQTLLEYSASFQDTHTYATMQSNFIADLGFYCDLYDGKVMIDQIDRSIVPARTYPFAVGDEFVSLDGVPALDVAKELVKREGWGNPRAALRFAIGDITYRGQSYQPLAVDLPDESTVVIRRRSGDLETYKIKWVKTGFPVRNLGSAPNLSPLSSRLQINSTEGGAIDTDEAGDRPAWKQLFYESRVFKVPSQRMRREKGETVQEDGARVPFEAVRGFGSRNPIWTLPAGFQVRLGRSASDIFYSGTYIADGQRIGYLRLKDFSFSTSAQLNQLATEIVYFNANTDGLVLDVMRNPGGYGCSAVNAITLVVPTKAQQIGFSIRPSLGWIQAYDAALLESQAFEDPQYVQDILQFQRDVIISAFNQPRGMTGALPLCGLDLPINTQRFAYSKPIITLVDDFSTSAGDMFPAMMQDNKRGKLVGMRTNGAGGDVIDLTRSPWSETNTTLTESMMTRSEEREYPGFPKSPFVENVGIRPEIELDYMTLDNLLNTGKPFVAAFTKIMVDEIRAAKP